jgi:aminopeptidase-like protein
MAATAVALSQHRAKSSWQVNVVLLDGELLVGDLLIQGESDREPMFSSYICHPSMAK